MSDRFINKVVWISGASQGIGRGIAEYFATEGASVALIDIKLEAGEKLVEQIRCKGGKATFIFCDVNNEESVKNCIAKTIEHFNGLDIIINNAAVNMVKPLHEYSSEEWDWQMGVNVKSIFLTLKHAYPFLKTRRSSYIVNIGSVSSFVGQANTPGYIASKGAVVMLTKSIAIDYAADGIRCNAVCPGITDTPMLREHMGSDALLQERLQRVPAGRILSPLDIARTVAYLSCDDSIGVTGTSILIDGGYLATAEWQGGSFV